MESKSQPAMSSFSTSVVGFDQLGSSTDRNGRLLEDQKNRTIKYFNKVAQNLNELGTSISAELSHIRNESVYTDEENRVTEAVLLSNRESGKMYPIGNKHCDSETAEGRADSKNELPRKVVAVKRETVNWLIDDDQKHADRLVSTAEDSADKEKKCIDESKVMKVEVQEEESRSMDCEMSESSGDTDDGEQETAHDFSRRSVPSSSKLESLELLKSEPNPEGVLDSCFSNKIEPCETTEADEKFCSNEPKLLPAGDKKDQMLACDAENQKTSQEASLPVSSDSNGPIDMRISVSEPKQGTVGNQKSLKTDVKSKSDNLRPVGRLLHDLGLDLVRQQVYKDLISIQVSKDTKNMLEEKEKEQLKRLTDAHAKLLVKNTVFQLPFLHCSCSFASSSANVMGLHHEFGSLYDPPFHTCCLCDSFKTRWPSQFLTHLESSHHKRGRVQAKMASNVCKYCPYEHKNQMRMEVHTAKCFKKFNLNTNLLPLPADCDVPLLGKTVQTSSSQSVKPAGAIVFQNPQPGPASQHIPKQIVPPSVPSGFQPSVMEIGGQLYSLVHHNGKALFTSLRSQVNNSAGASNQSTSLGVKPGNFPRFVQPPIRHGLNELSAARREKCEMCDAFVNDREALWIHFRALHKVELSKVSMLEKEPWMMCDLCSAKFWTYQGLARHNMQQHKRELVPPAMPTKSFKCFLCFQVQSNPLNHLSTYHNITLLDMYHSRRCCMCNRRFRTARAFEEHMVLQHHDIFANKDVLCTVLQALSMALSLKKQETSTQQHQIQMAAVAAAAAMKCGQQGSSSHTVTSNPGQSKNSPSPARSSSASGKGSAVGGTPSPNKNPKLPELKKRAYRRQSGDHAKESSQATSKTPKKTDEEDAKELNKLYEEYANIGRPILRSMRHRLSQGGSGVSEKGQDPAESKANETEKMNAGVPNVQNEVPKQGGGQDSVADEEPAVKRLCLESNQKSKETKDPISADEQLEDCNGGQKTEPAPSQSVS